MYPSASLLQHKIIQLVVALKKANSSPNYEYF